MAPRCPRAAGEKGRARDPTCRQGEGTAPARPTAERGGGSEGNIGTPVHQAAPHSGPGPVTVPLGQKHTGHGHGPESKAEALRQPVLPCPHLQKWPLSLAGGWARRLGQRLGQEAGLAAGPLPSPWGTLGWGCPRDGKWGPHPCAWPRRGSWHGGAGTRGNRAGAERGTSSRASHRPPGALGSSPASEGRTGVAPPPR